ncbi:alpha/beta-Hydrolase [Glarea lozoyensis ATCC 20868]|uniref:Alpha/beta-Hydrolase n=1 Tax=Glarea lozoyensis (strain ATCC 20868 / MF5171) TaxID=1116229 RepID=S3D7X6_GLAL2|nr:alpha/beta-Hydrolase [Glarea lozoyensis ATCC 20868]EPE34612.1 alpha/beta-Hydrolase [Glarea lozoyensis ATCC 20868]
MARCKLHQIDSTTTLHTSITGNPSSLPTLVFLHFWGGSSATYAPLISHLTSYHTISIDFRGLGLSTGPDDQSAYSIKHLALDIEDLLSKLALRDILLVGHSMGGKVAQLIAGRNNTPNLKGLILIAPAPPTPLVLPDDLREQSYTAYETRESCEFVIRNVLTSSTLTDEATEALVRDMLRGNRHARRAWPEYGMAEDIREEVKGMRCPVLVAAGENDVVETRERLEREVVGCYEGGEMVVVEGVGHLMVVEAPAEVARVVEEFVAGI